MVEMKKISHIGVTLTHGCDIKGGESAMDVLAQHLSFDERIELNQTLLKKEQPLYLTAVLDLNQRLKDTLRHRLDKGELPIVYGGDHALAIGSLAAHTHPNQAVLWIDAHGDCNTHETSLTQRIHGMPLAVAQGQGHPVLTQLVDYPIDPKHVLLIGIRDLDPLEEALMKSWGNRYITMTEIRDKGFDWLLEEVYVFMTKHEQVHCSFDCDSMDPYMIPGVNTPVSGGFTVDEILPILQTIFSSDHLNALDIVEFNPTRDTQATLSLILTLTKMLHEAVEA